MSLNKVQIIGRLGADPEVRNIQSGSRVVNMRLAVSERWTQNGEKKERTEWVPVVIWNEKLGEIAERYLKKGRNVYVEGQWQTRKWTDQSGNERYSTEVVLSKFRGELVLLDSARDSDSAEAPAARAPEGRRSAAPAGGSTGADLDDRIPF